MLWLSNYERNVPFGGNRVGPSVTRENLGTILEANRRTLLVPGDFSETLTHVEPGDFVYLDPPYSIHGVRVFNEYVLRGFGALDLQRLRLHLENLHSMQCRFLVSYADCEEGRALGHGLRSTSWRLRETSAASGLGVEKPGRS